MSLCVELETKYHKEVDNTSVIWFLMERIILATNEIQRRELMIELAFMTDAKWWLERENLI